MALLQVLEGLASAVPSLGLRSHTERVALAVPQTVAPRVQLAGPIRAVAVGGLLATLVVLRAPQGREALASSSSATSAARAWRLAAR